MEENKKVVLGSTEELIKVYNYFKFNSSSKDVEDYSNSLTVTTDRIIIESVTKSGFVRDEYPLDCFERIDSQFFFSKKSKVGLLLLILGLVIVIGTLSFEFFVQSILYVLLGGIGLGAAIAILGLVLLIKLKSKQSFRLTLYSTKKFSSLTTLSGENFSISKRKLKRTKEVTKSKIVADVTEDALKMLNELNGLLIEIRHFKEKVKFMQDMLFQNIITVGEYEEDYEKLLTTLKR